MVLKKEKAINILKWICFTLGCIIMAFAFNIFYMPNKIAPGGFSGLATVFYTVTGFPVGTATFLMCIPLFLILYKQDGKKGLIKTLYGTFVFSFFLDTLKFEGITDDMVLASVFGGVIYGIGSGIVFKVGGSTGGTDTVAMIVQKKVPSMNLGVLVMLFDGIVIMIAGLVLKNIEVMLYSAIAIFVSSKVIDLIQSGINYARAFYIFTDEVDLLKDEIYKKLDRGITILHAKGGYKKEDRNVILCVVDRPQVTKLKQIIRQVDENAFVILAQVSEVLGEGFKGHS